jgi:hypothetical protein
MTPDYEMWLAMHDDCPWPGCGGCADIEVEIETDLLRWLQTAAYLIGEALDVFMTKAAIEGAKMVLGQAA